MWIRARAVQLFVLMVIVLGVSPIFAPSLGASLIYFSAWPITFWLMGGLAIVSLLAIALFLEETLARTNRAADLSSVQLVLSRPCRPSSMIVDDSARPLAIVIGICAVLTAFTHYMPWFKHTLKPIRA